MNNPMKLPQIVLYLIFVLIPSARAGELTLQQAVNLGLKNNFNIRISKNLNTLAHNNKRLATASFAPHISASGAVQRNGVDSSLSLPWNFKSDLKTLQRDAGLQINWTLFDGFRMFYTYKFAHETAERSDVQYRDDIETAVVRMMTAYFHQATQKQHLKTAEEQVSLSENRLARVKVRRELGQGTQSELLKAQVDLNADKSALEGRRLAYIDARNRLALSLGGTVKDSIATVIDTTIPGPKLADIDTWLSLATKNNRRLDMLQRRKRMAILQLSIARSARWPQISASGHYGWQKADVNMSAADFERRNTQVSIGLRAVVPLFSGFGIGTDIKNKKLEKQNAGLSFTQYRRQLEALVHYQYQAVINTKNQLVYNEDGVELAEIHLSLLAEARRLGRATGLEYREAQQALADARIRRFSSLFAHRLALLELQRLAGKIKMDF